MLNRRLSRLYRKFRGTGCIVGEDARYALHAARTEMLWDRLESAGLVRLEAVPDESFDWSEVSDAERERFGRDGAWGSVGSFRLSEDEQWEHGDSVWGHVGYSNVLSPVENPYVIDVKAQTIQALRDALKSRCSVCRCPQAA